jgi:hypothetical protein
MLFERRTKMKVANFPGCCTARVLCNFGGTEVTAGRKASHTLEEVEKWITSKLSGNCSVVITNSDQGVVNQALRNLGFKHSTWMKKRYHSRTKIRLWWKEPKPILTFSRDGFAATCIRQRRFLAHPGTGGFHIIK